ncbi:hypothetical protein SDC9_147225 [bioreactor metagenome]|uniref:Uncharacterized protein n=1 Tax=bioreactor metagenome TaxID=1076179 RepID=A0A645EDR6_9ZZZZ
MLLGQVPRGKQAEQHVQHPHARQAEEEAEKEVEGHLGPCLGDQLRVKHPLAAGHKLFGDSGHIVTGQGKDR